jgi:hypothetical protein
MELVSSRNEFETVLFDQIILKIVLLRGKKKSLIEERKQTLIKRFKF